MWIKFNLHGMKIKLKIEQYKPNQTICGEWAETSFSFEFQDVIKYSANKAQILLNSEVDKIREYTEKLLNGKLDEEVIYKCIEPDFEFTFSPKYDVRNDADITWVKPGYEIRNIKMKLKINLWNKGLTCNNFSTVFDKEEIEAFYLYLSLITNKISKDNDKINNLIKAGIIYDNNEI